MKPTLQLFSLLFAGSLLFSSEAKSQVQECGTDEYNRELEAQSPELARYREQMQAQVQQYLANNPTGSNQKSTVKLIPVVVHLITETGGGGLTKQEIEQGIAHMNDDFRRLNSDTTLVRQLFKGLVSDTEIEFRLARLDPNGNCTEGIVRVASPLTNSASPSNAVKDLTYWPADRYFNIWLVNSITNASGGGLNGYAQFPGSAINTYGVVCRIDRFGLSSTNGIRARTLSHEVGHCLGLYHTFQGNCGSNCASSGDQVCDTPPTSQASYTCDPGLNTCSNDMSGTGGFTADVPDQFENYMAYGDCRIMFTHGQKARMQATLSTYAFLQDLTSPANAAATGISLPVPPVCAPIAQFSASQTKACTSQNVTFTDLSFNATPDATWTWNWSFPGGVPATSTSQNPVVQYSAPGTYPVTLTVSNSAGTDAATKTNYVTVWSSSGETAPFVQGFEEAAFPAHATDPAKDWVIESASSNTWERFTGASAIGSASLRIRNQVIANGTINSVITPAFNLTGLTNPTFTFDVAHAMGSATSNDRLKVYYSTDCGNTWTLRFAKSGASLSTVGSQLQPNFTPSQASHWLTESITLNSGLLQSNIRFKFESESGQGNAIYLDNINISGISATEELTSAAINLFPNPAENQVLVQVNLLKESAISCILLDMTGREVHKTITGVKEKGNCELPLNLAGLPAGVYVVQVTDGVSVITQKLVKQ